MRKFYYKERARQTSLIEKGFFTDKGNGYFRKKQYPYILRNGLNNIYEPIRKETLKYFVDNGISWWSGYKPTGHVLSSQIACINHLLPLRHDRQAVLALINGVRNQFIDVLPLGCDTDESYIALEAVSKVDHLNEDKPTRGTNCTSVDALVLAVDKNNERWLIPIEWKYTESYSDAPSSDKSLGDKGIVRMDRYRDLIEASDQLKTPAKFEGSIYFFEPFYQLMRQTLWAEQMIKHKDSEVIQADHFMHIHVIPSADTDLLQKEYRLTKKNMEETWRSCIKDQSKYVIVDPKVFMQQIKDSYSDLYNYLLPRYYNID